MTGESKEPILDKIGSFGLYQLRVFGIMSYASCFFAIGTLVITFSTAEPPWRCKANSTSCTLNGTFKAGDREYEHRCSIPRKDWEFAVEGDVYSIVTEWDLVCERGVQASLVNSLAFLFGIVGSLTSSIVSDKYGRKKVALLSSFYLGTCGLLSAFAPTYWVFALFRILVGIGLGCGPVAYTLVIEYVGIRHRSAVGCAYWLSWELGMCLLALLGYLVQNWRLLTIITSVPGMLIVLFWWWTPESLRWLLVRGKIDEATKTLKTAARVNKKVILDEDMTLLEAYEDKRTLGEERIGDLRDLFASRLMAHRTLFSWFCWFVSGLVYYGITLSLPTVGGNMYLNLFLSAVCEIMAIVVGIPALKRLGRKKTIILSLWMAAVFMITAALLSYYDDGSKGFLAGKILSAVVLGKLFITVAFNGVYVYSSELFPTVVRNTAMGTSESANNIGSACSSYIVYSQRLHPLMPFGIMAANVLVCGIMFITLPETSNKAMPDNMKQVDLRNQASGVEVHEEPSIQQI